jgi:hypothetical protein
MPEGFIQEFLFFRDSQEGEKGKLGGNKPAETEGCAWTIARTIR